ncbi:uncharacterized protein Z519_11052 [Cladophialophora bantiana CBS 173.52]|uniref:Amidohydrolase-related domain-containing protein n=1 Tax=Cladophialophora bantiana (strain ATCC 10958 / CBS 173.52 / CDC B-1940 / NIH 8579) TaxID=1442370 RepID=A0A0D2H5B6_CLAB1|nr:uncharacterized protein Z519_11052 [Cladophialophora bantiana CBS 173.52]KIW88483.1 hypothetical protein Z519_11052 [Cladophialophora bantiana CBS 173.52]
MATDASTLTIEGRPLSSFKPTHEERKRTGLITFEEHAITPFPVPSTSVTFETFNPDFLGGLKQRLQDIELRVKIMDANNIAAQIISLNQPTAQAFVKVDDCVEFCRKANEFVFQNYCAKYPKRFFAFATLPTQDGTAAAAELERCVKEYGFVGAMINGYTVTEDPTKGLYLDDPQYDTLWEVSERLGKPIFIHPRVPLQSNLNVLKDIPILHGAPYGFGRETVEHLLRIMYAGVFDRFPKLKICLGHSGEGLSWILPRTDTTFRMYTKAAQGPKKKSFLYYFQNNIICNTSGMPRTSALLNLLSETKVENVTFSVDYPYESIAEMRSWFECVPISDETWKDIGYRNAIRIFNLPLDIN